MVPGRDMKTNRELLVDFIASAIRNYPDFEEAIANLIDMSDGKHGKTLLEKSNTAKVFSFTIERRGVKYIISRGSTIRNTHGYNVFGADKVKDDTPTNVEDNPMMEVELILRTKEKAILLRPY